MFAPPLGRAGGPGWGALRASVVGEGQPFWPGRGQAERQDGACPGGGGPSAVSLADPTAREAEREDRVSIARLPKAEAVRPNIEFWAGLKRREQRLSPA